MKIWTDAFHANNDWFVQDARTIYYVHSKRIQVLLNRRIELIQETVKSWETLAQSAS